MRIDHIRTNRAEVWDTNPRGMNTQKASLIKNKEGYQKKIK